MAPKNNKKSEIDNAKRKLFAYSPSKVALALRAIQGGMKVATASRTFRVPRSTLRHKVSGHAPETSGHVGPQPVLGNDIENSLVTWIKECSRAGFPINKDGLLDSVKKIVIAGNLETPFINNRPGRSWFLSFMARHPDLSKKHAEYINKARAIITEERIRKWFEEVTELLGPEGSEVLKEPKRVWNSDETSFFLAPKGGLILAPKGEHVYDTSKNSDKENITTLFTVNAEGDMAPPLTLYKYKRMNQDVVQNAPDDWSIGKTDKGWMTAESFYEYIGNVFIPYLKKEGIILPVILFLDGHRSHLSLHLSTLCRDNGIIVVALVPNTTHMLQPLDVAVFYPLKQCWLKYVRKWRIDHDGEEITKFNLPSALRDIFINDPHFADNVRAGFKTCGLYPFDANQVNCKRIIQRPKESETNSHIQVVESTHLQFLESKISPDLLKDFQQTYSNGLDWTGCVEAVHLYKVWQDFKDDYTSLTYQSHNDQPCLIAQSTDIVCPTPSSTPNNTVDKNAALTENKEMTEERVDMDASLTLNNKDILDKTQVVDTSINSIVSTSSIIKSPRDALNLVKSCIKWPEKISPGCSSTRKREYIPSVLTSDQWKDIMVAKEKERQDKEKQKQNKLKNKKEKKSKDGEKAKKKKPNVKKQAIQIWESETSEEELFSTRDSDDTDATEGLLNEEQIETIDEETVDDYGIGDFVIFLYDGEHFVGKIESITEEAVLIRAMQKSLKNWKWPDKSDLNLYAKADIKQKIKTPMKINSKREFFYVPEMAKYWEFVNC